MKQWLVKRGYKEDYVGSEIERVKLIKKTVSFQNRDKKVDDSIVVSKTWIQRGSCWFRNWKSEIDKENIFHLSVTVVT